MKMTREDLEQLVQDMSQFTPAVVGKCPECGHFVFEGYCCHCGVDYSYEENERKLLRAW